MGINPAPTITGNFCDYPYFRPRHSAWKNSCDSLAVVGLYENLTPVLRFQRRRWPEKFTRLRRAASLIDKETLVMFHIRG